MSRALILSAVLVALQTGAVGECAATARLGAAGPLRWSDAELAGPMVQDRQHDGDDLPSGRELADRVIAALEQVQVAQYEARLPNGHRTLTTYVAPDRASLQEWDEHDREGAHYTIIGDVGYLERPLPDSLSTCSHSVNEGFRRQAEVFQPIETALATGEPEALTAGAEVERTTERGLPALRARFVYSASPELERLGLRRTEPGSLEVVVDPGTSLPYRTVEEYQSGTTEVTFITFDEPLHVEAPAFC
jgi:hypothetical protein